MTKLVQADFFPLKYVCCACTRLVIDCGLFLFNRQSWQVAMFGIHDFPVFLVAGIVPGVCTALMQWNDGNPFYICIFVLIAAATSAFSAFTIQRRHNRAERRAQALNGAQAGAKL